MDGWKIEACVNQEVKAVISFLDPLLYPNKPLKVTVRLASTLVACMFERRETKLARIFKEVIQKQTSAKVLKTPTSLSCYLVCLYKRKSVKQG
jgi:hypothetical protein